MTATRQLFPDALVTDLDLDRLGGLALGIFVRGFSLVVRVRVGRLFRLALGLAGSFVAGIVAELDGSVRRPDRHA